MEKPIRNRRRQYIINKPVQKRIIFTVSFIPVVGLVGATLAVAVLAGKVLEEARSVDENLPTLGPLFIALLFFILSTGGVVILQAMRYSNKIAGPMYRLVKSLQRIREGDLEFTVKLREGDELTELADELNRHIQWLVQHPPQDVDFNRATGEPGATDQNVAETPATEPVSAGGPPEDEKPN